MSLISLSITAVCCLISAVIGYSVAGLVRTSNRRTTRAASKNDNASGKDQPNAEEQLKLLVESLYELTSQVDSQVGEHSTRVNEITNSLEAPDEVGSSMVLAAGKLLVSANQKLQADLIEAKSEIQRQREQANTCMQESRTDALTNLANRRAFDLEFSRAFAQRRRDGQSFSLLIIDIDHFKRINDKYGHMVGDQLLKCFARCLTNAFRESDFVARFGGEEFIAILPKTPLSEALKAAERVRAAIVESRFKVGDLDIQITASLGVKEVQDQETDAELLERADVALYAAKTSGRNRCYYHDGVSSFHFLPPLEAEITDPELSTVAVVEPNSVLQVSQAGTSRKAVSAGTREKQVQL